jgi:glycosyltransferase involved in cell wall biosynthesis
MRIAMIISAPIPPREGIGFYTWNLAHQLTRQGHEVHIITRGCARNTRKEIIEKVTIWKPPFLPIYPLHVHFHSLFVDWLLGRLRPGFDLLHLHIPLVKHPKTKLPTLVTVHTPMKADVGSITPNTPLAILTKLQAPISIQLEKEVLNKAVKITAVAHSVANELSAYGIDPRIVSVLGNGVDTQTFFPDEVEPVFPHPYILTAGRLGLRKGLEDLIQCAQRIIEEHQELIFIIAGEGPLRKKLQNKINQLGLNKRILLIGHVNDRQQMSQLYRGATIFVHPAHYEGLPAALLEAMSCACPVVTTAVSGAVDIIQDGWNGLLVPPHSPEELAKAIKRILGSPGMGKKLGKNAYNSTARRNDWRVVCQNYLTHYQLILKNL